MVAAYQHRVTSEHIRSDNTVIKGGRGLSVINILGSESWLDKDITTSEIFPPEYQVLRRDRNSKARGGGVFIAVKKHYDMTLLPDLLTNCEILRAKVQISASKSLTLGCFYRPPDSKISTSEELVKSLDLMPKNSNQTIVLGGDFNLPGIDWNNGVVNPKAANKSYTAHPRHYYFAC